MTERKKICFEKLTIPEEEQALGGHDPQDPPDPPDTTGEACVSIPAPEMACTCILCG